MLDSAYLAFYQREYERLVADLEQAYQLSTLPEQARGAEGAKRFACKSAAGEAAVTCVALALPVLDG